MSKKYDITTTDLSRFGYRELAMLEELLKAMREQGLPDDFYGDEVVPMMNFYSGNVFLVNSDYQVAMMNGDKLENFYSLCYHGNEGFLDELLEQYKNGEVMDEDIEELANICKQKGLNDEAEKIMTKANIEEEQMMSKYKLYTAHSAGIKYDGDKKYKMVIITKWKDTKEDSPEEGHKAYYFTPDNKYLSECIEDEDWCRRIYESYPENMRFRIERKVECYAEN